MAKNETKCELAGLKRSKAAKKIEFASLPRFWRPGGMVANLPSHVTPPANSRGLFWQSSVSPVVQNSAPPDSDLSGMVALVCAAPRAILLVAPKIFQKSVKIFQNLPQSARPPKHKHMADAPIAR